jgi:hypothetical protein
MTRLQALISKVESLPQEEQEVITNALEHITSSVDNSFAMNDEERAYVVSLLKTDTGAHALEEVFATL